uniref:Transcription elongation factor Spt4 n=1 Tax=Fervidicoccus fontis TaxID=683846 RepID=A0A7J3ZLT5_9CREN
MISRKKAGFKACLKCRLLVDPSVEVCPNCSSRDFTLDWEGMVIVLEPETSEVAKMLDIKSPGRYALRVR